MQLNTSTTDIADQEVDTIILNLFENTKSPQDATASTDQRLEGTISTLLTGGDFKGKLRETSVLYPGNALPAQRIIIVGLGPREDFTLDCARHAAAAAAIRAQELGARSIASVVHGTGVGKMEIGAAARATAEGTLLGLYSFQKYKSEAQNTKVSSFSLVESNEQQAEALSVGAHEGNIIADCVCQARNLVNEPPNTCTPSFLASYAKKLAADHNMTTRILSESDARELNMGAFLSVGQGSAQQSQLIILEHNRGLLADTNPLVLVGKAITFDTGGYSMKSVQGMEDMKTDMAGGAAVLSAMQAAARLQVPYPVVGLVPASENMIGSQASRPSDVVRAANGKTIEIVNTDAEGRLILADALVYAARYNPTALIDIATLTGAAVIALGEGSAAALFTDDEILAQHLSLASQSSGERIWRMPLYPEYGKLMRGSDVADLRNSPNKRYAGIGTSAAFLQEFTGGFRWAHLDIAAMANQPASKVIQTLGPAGASGFGVRLLSYMMLDDDYASWQSSASGN